MLAAVEGAGRLRGVMVAAAERWRAAAAAADTAARRAFVASAAASSASRDCMASAMSLFTGPLTARRGPRLSCFTASPLDGLSAARTTSPDPWPPAAACTTLKAVSLATAGRP